MSITLSSLSAKLGSNVVDTDIFLISDSTSTNDNKIEQVLPIDHPWYTTFTKEQITYVKQ